MSKTQHYSRSQLFWLVALRVLTGWYFLYEGLSKVLAPNWSAFGYLKDSKGLFAPLFNLLTENSIVMEFVNMANIYGLIIIGLCLILGCFVKIAGIGAISLLALYYLSHPPLIDVNYVLRPEGSYLWVDKNLIIMCAVFVLLNFPTSKRIGLDRIFQRDNKKNKK
ncbi:MAG: DoxX family membrane protein [Paludibacter sp.]|nr:DoxX family membrane protein [Paludibacter sp.]